MTKSAVRAAVEKSLRNQRVVLHLTNGDQLEVPHPDYVAFSPTSTEIIVWPQGPGFAVVSLDEIAGIAIAPAG